NPGHLRQPGLFKIRQLFSGLFRHNWQLKFRFTSRLHVSLFLHIYKNLLLQKNKKPERTNTPALKR
ncbi:hypothetical protein, partial [Taibaiella soli]|uniref:hypothetical protein n=1 Tax=Taibaiella soli TaxID=1649169 RepID=UPI001A9E8242